MHERFARYYVQQQQYIAHLQAQMNVQKTNVNTQEFWDTGNSYADNDIHSLERQYRREAQEQGLSLDMYLDYKQRSMAVDNQIFTAMQNNMTENHVMMMNLLSTDSDYEYKVVYPTKY